MGSGQHTNKLDLTMTGPRITQYYTGQSTKYSDIYVASNANENWVTDEGREQTILIMHIKQEILIIRFRAGISTGASCNSKTGTQRYTLFADSTQ